MAVRGEQSPAWLGVGLLVLGTGSWVGAGTTANAGVAPSVATAVVHRAPALEAPPTPVAVEPEPEPQAEPEPQPAPPCAPFVEVRFDHGVSQRPMEDDLAAIIDAANRHPGQTVVVEGYASASGTAEENLALSHRRAGKAKKALVDAGLPATRISVQAFGEYRPNLEGDEARDRRVVIRLDGMPACPPDEETRGD